MTAETQNDIGNKLGEYIRQEVSKGSDAVLEVVSEGHKLLMESFAGLSDEQATWKAGPDEWSVLETMHHVISGKRGHALECAALARGELLGGPDAGDDFWREFYGNLVGPPYTSLEEARTDAEKGQREMVAFLNGVSAETNVEKTATHPLVGPMNCLGTAVFQRIHDGDHTGQIGKIKASPGFPSS